MESSLELLNDDDIYTVCKYLDNKDILRLFDANGWYMPTMVTRLCIKNVKPVFNLCENCCTVTVPIPGGTIGEKGLHLIKTDPGYLYAIGIQSNPELNGDRITLTSPDGSNNVVIYNHKIEPIVTYISCSRKGEYILTPTGNFKLSYLNTNGKSKKVVIVFHMYDLKK